MTPPSKTSTHLHRPQRKRLLAGVCAGFSQQLGIDVTFIRLFFVALTLIGGIGIIVYILFWFITPDK